MRPVPGLLLVGAGVVTLCASGCLGPMYNPYGAWGTPGHSSYTYPGYGTPGMGYPAYGAPGSFQTLTPGGQYVPGTTTTPGAAPTPTYAPGGNAPPYGSGGNVPVPNPSDPGPYYPGTGENYLPPRTGAFREPDPGEWPLSQGADALPAESRSIASGPRLRPASHAAAPQSAESDDFGHDADNYRWLSGVVQFDPVDRTWSIHYARDPQADEPFSGRLTLAPSPLLQTLRDGERVRLEGAIDPRQPDRHGKSTYAAQRIVRVAA